MTDTELNDLKRQDRELYEEINRVRAQLDPLNKLWLDVRMKITREEMRRSFADEMAHGGGA